MGNAKAQIGLASSCNANRQMHVGHVLTRRKKPCLWLWYKIPCVCLTPVFFFLFLFCFCFVLFCFVLFCFALFSFALFCFVLFFGCFVLFCFVCFSKFVCELLKVGPSRRHGYRLRWLGSWTSQPLSQQGRNKNYGVGLIIVL